MNEIVPAVDINVGDRIQLNGDTYYVEFVKPTPTGPTFSIVREDPEDEGSSILICGSTAAIHRVERAQL